MAAISIRIEKNNYNTVDSLDIASHVTRVSSTPVSRVVWVVKVVHLSCRIPHEHRDYTDFLCNSETLWKDKQLGNS